jgi:4-amino-4-deoxy-L-arabinose transferase-like glycosyltransferase
VLERAGDRGRRGKARGTLSRALAARPVAAILLLLGCLYLPWLGAIPIVGTLESNRLESAREMLRSGDWIVPRLGGGVYLAKPPMFPWTVAGFSAPFGDVSLWSGRLVTVACALLLCGLVFVWGRREIGKRAGSYAALALGVSVLFLQKALRAELELELTLFTGAALLGLWSGVRSSRAAPAAGLALGAAMLVKGPVALLVFGACAAVLLVGARSARRTFAKHTALALAIALLCAAAWVVPLCLRLGLDTSWRAFQDEFVHRISSPGRTNAEPVWFYLPAIAAGLLPAALHFPCLGLVLPGAVALDERARLRSVFLWGWALAPLVLFSASAGKEARYLLPTIPAWTLLIGWGWTRACSSRRFVGWRSALRRGAVVGSWLLPPAWIAYGILRFPDARAIVLATGFGLLAVRGILSWSARTGRAAVLLGTLAAGVLVGKLAWAATFLEQQRKAMPLEDVGQAIDARLAPDEPWILVGPYRSWLAFEVDRPCSNFRDWGEWRRASFGRAGRWALAPASAGVGAGTIAASWMLDGAEYRLFDLQGDAPAR